MEPIVRAALDEDIDQADRVLRLAFGTQEGLPDPMTVFGDREMIRARWRGGTSTILVAELESRVAGTASLTRWGSLGFVGRMGVDPAHQGAGVASAIMREALRRFDSWAVTLVGLDTFPESPKHIHLYQKFGLWPRFLNALMYKPVTMDAKTGDGVLLSTLSDQDQSSFIEESRRLTETIYPGLDVSAEIRATRALSLGDTIIVRRGSESLGFAVCHAGPGTEAGSGACFVKFGMVDPTRYPDQAFAELIRGCESYAAARGAEKITTSVSTARREAYRSMLDHGFKLSSTKVAMASPDVFSYDRPGIYVLDRWS